MSNSLAASGGGNISKPQTAAAKSRPHTQNPKSRSTTAAGGRRALSASKALPEWSDSSIVNEKFTLKHAFEDETNIELPLSRKIGSWKRPVDIFVPHKEQKERAERNRAEKDGAEPHVPPFCIVTPFTSTRSPTPATGIRVAAATASKSEIHLRPSDPSQSNSPDMINDQYQREHFLNVDCFSRLVNGAVLPPPHSASPQPPPIPEEPRSESPTKGEHEKKVDHDKKEDKNHDKKGEDKKSDQEKKDEKKADVEKKNGDQDKRAETERKTERKTEEAPVEPPPELDPQQQQLQLIQQQAQQLQNQQQHPVDTRFLTSVFNVMLQNEYKVAEGGLLWELIYPKGRDGRPIYNPSGRYIVRLFVMGSWRKVVIDDRIPLDENNSIMFMQTNNVLELWPLLLAKALFKVATIMQANTACEPEFLYWLGGWMPQPEPIIEDSTWTFLHNLQESNHVIMCASVAPLYADSFIDSLDSIKLAFQSGLRAGQLYMVCGLTTQPKSVHLRTLPPPRAASVPRPHSARPSRPPSAQVIHTDEMPYHGSDVWIPYEDFCASFKNIILYHSPDYTSQAIVQALGDVPPNIPPLLYTESDKPTHITVSITISPKAEPVEGEEGVSLLLDGYHWKTIGTNPEPPLFTLKTKTSLCTVVWVPAGRNVYKILMNGRGIGGYQVRFLSPAVLLVGEYSKVLPKLTLEVSEFDPVYKLSDTGIWSLWFKYIVQVQEEGMWSWQLVPQESASMTLVNSPSNHSISQNGAAPIVPSPSSIGPYPYVRLRVIDNDTFEEYASLLGCTPPRRYLPNTLGYTVMAECKCPFRVPSSKCKLRVISTSPKFTAEPEPVRCVYEYEGTYSPNQAAPLFRDVLRVKERAQVAIHVGVPPGNGHVYLKVQIFDKGEEIYATEGKRSCIIPVLYLYPTLKKEDEFHKYIIQTSITRYVQSDTDDTPRARANRTRKSKKKEKGKSAVLGAQGGGASSAWLEDEFVWQLRIMSCVAVEVRKDTEREDRQANIKASWEAPAPGRAAKARVSRDKYLHGLALVPPSSNDPEKDSAPKYVKYSTLPPAKIRIKRNSEEEVLDMDQIIQPARSYESPTAAKSLVRIRSQPPQIPPAVPAPVITPTPTTPTAASPRSTLRVITPNTYNAPLIPTPSRLTPLAFTQSNISPPFFLQPPATPPIASIANSPSTSFILSPHVSKLNPNARVRTEADIAEAARAAEAEQDEFVDWYNATVVRCRDSVQEAEQTRDSLASYLESRRTEAAKMNLSFAERLAQYNAKFFPALKSASSHNIPDAHAKDHAKEHAKDHVKEVPVKELPSAAKAKPPPSRAKKTK